MRILEKVVIPALVSLLCLGAAWAAPVDLALPDMAGKQQRLSDYRGKWVVVNFWASWCPPCLEEMPELDAFHNVHKDAGAVVLGVNMEEIEVGQLLQFVARLGISFPIVRMEPALDTPLGKVLGMPTTFLVNPQGEVVAREVGAVTAKDLEAAIERFKAAEGGKS